MTARRGDSPSPVPLGSPLEDVVAVRRAEAAAERAWHAERDALGRPDRDDVRRGVPDLVFGVVVILVVCVTFTLTLVPPWVTRPAPACLATLDAPRSESGYLTVLRDSDGVSYAVCVDAAGDVAEATSFPDARGWESWDVLRDRLAVDPRATEVAGRFR